MKQWMALNLLIPQEFQEAISNFLMEQGATGLEETERDHRTSELKAYFPRDGKEKRRCSCPSSVSEIPQAALSSRRFPAALRRRLIPEQDWGENWKKFFKPVSIGSRFVVFPPWEKVRLKKGQIPSRDYPRNGLWHRNPCHDPTLHSGPGEKAEERKGLSVLDVGTGSGNSGHRCR